MIILPTDKFQRWVDNLQQAQPIHPDQTKQTITAAFQPKKRKWPWIVSTVAVALIVFGVSAATLEPVQQVLAKVPVIGWWFRSTEAKIVAKAGKLQGVNLTQTDHGVTMTLKSAYVQGHTIAVSGVVSGIDPDHTTAGSGLEYHLAKPNMHIHMNRASWKNKSGGTYSFMVLGEVDHLASGKHLALPLVFTEMLGTKMHLHFNLQLTASQATKVALSGQSQAGGYHFKVLSAKNYDGGTGLLKLQVTLPKQMTQYRVNIGNLRVNGSDQNYLLGRANDKTQIGLTQTLTYRTKAFPKHIAKLSFTPVLTDVAQPKQYRLSALPAELPIADRPVVYRFQPATLTDQQLTFNFSLTGIKASDRDLQDHLLHYGMWLRLVDDHAEKQLANDYNAKGIGVNMIAPLVFWSQGQHRFMAKVDLTATPFKNHALDELALVVPIAFEKSQTLPKVTLANR